MRVSDRFLDDVRMSGFAVMPNFLAAEELAAAQECLWDNFPQPNDYFADPAAHSPFKRSQFAGLRYFPWVGWDVNRLAFHPDLVDAAARYLGTEDLSLYKGELWAKYAGAIDYDQAHHRDFGNHSLVVPRRDGYLTQLTSFILLSDVTELDAPTAVVPLQHTNDIPMVPEVTDPRSSHSVPIGTLDDHEVLVTGPAGSLFMYRTDVFHRGTDFTAPGRSRFAVLADYCARATTWHGKIAWPNHAQSPHFREVMERCSLRERDLFGFPRPGDQYWNDETIEGVQRRYQRMDMTPYRNAVATAPGQSG